MTQVNVFSLNPWYWTECPLSRWSRLADSRAYRRALAEIQAAGPACVICGHGGSDSIHHRIPPSRFPQVAAELARDPANWAPSHGVKGCPVCGVRCNQAQGNKLTPIHRPRSRRW